MIFLCECIQYRVSSSNELENLIRHVRYNTRDKHNDYNMSVKYQNTIKFIKNDL